MGIFFGLGLGIESCAQTLITLFTTTKIVFEEGISQKRLGPMGLVPPFYLVESYSPIFGLGTHPIPSLLFHSDKSLQFKFIKLILELLSWFLLHHLLHLSVYNKILYPKLESRAQKLTYFYQECAIILTRGTMGFQQYIKIDRCYLMLPNYAS